MVMIAILTWIWTRPSPPKRQSVLKVFAVTGASERPARKQPVQIKTAPAPTPKSLSVDMEATVVSAGGNAGSVCHTASDLQEAIAIDETSLDELAALPPVAVSVANAVVLWTPPPDVLASGPQNPFASPVVSGVELKPLWRTLPHISATVLEALSAQSPQCLDVDQTGPNFIFINKNGTSISVAIGSGRWRWRNFADDLISAVKPKS